MKGKKRPTIAIMAGNAESEYVAKLMAGFRNCAKEEDVNLVFLLGPHIPRYCKDILSGSFAWDYDFQFHTVYDYVHFIKPDALIIAYGSLTHFKHVPNVEEFVARFKEIPTLILGDAVSDPKVPYLIGGNYGGMKESVRHLVEDHGYRKIAFVGGPKRNFDSNRRMAAYKDVLKENGIPVDESLITHGNYTEHIDAELNELLDNHPDIEAIVFANDNMAKGGYRVCAARDLVVGHDIAITGFDDGDIAKSLEPALSSVAHSSFLFSYRAVQAAMELARGKMPVSEEMKAYFHKRESCGCKFALNEMNKYQNLFDLRESMKSRVVMITDELFSTIPYEKDKSKYREWLDEFLSEIIHTVFEESKEDIYNETIHRNLKNLCQRTFVSKRFLLEYLERVMYELMEFAQEESQKVELNTLLRTIRKFIHSQEVDVLQEENIDVQRKMWFLPSFTVDLINANLDIEEQMYYIMNRLKAMGVTSSYVFFYGDGISHKMNEDFELPETIYLNAYYNENEMVYYKPKQRLPISTTNGDIAQFLQQDKPRFYTGYVLFSADEQYGFILCETEQKDFSFMLSCSMQLGSLRRIMDMNMREEQMKKELEEKNRILSTISMYDELTKLLNRRGFMEHALKLLRDKQQQKICVVFADLDHLKEINDTFGHAAGDFAIISAAEYINACMPTGAVNARIGGDEYVSLFVPKEKCCVEDIMKSVKSYAKEFNENSEKPFYVDLSVGMYEFIYDDDVDLAEMLKKSDEVLYEQKKNRKVSIKK